MSRLPRLEAVSPLPRDEATPPVTKTCLVGALEAKKNSRGRLVNPQMQGLLRGSRLPTNRPGRAISRRDAPDQRPVDFGRAGSVGALGAVLPAAAGSRGPSASSATIRPAVVCVGVDRTTRSR